MIGVIIDMDMCIRRSIKIAHLHLRLLIGKVKFITVNGVNNLVKFEKELGFFDALQMVRLILVLNCSARRRPTEAMRSGHR